MDHDESAVGTPPDVELDDVCPGICRGLESRECVLRMTRRVAPVGNDGRPGAEIQERGNSLTAATLKRSKTSVPRGSLTA